ncbi:hypothetical protein Tco_0833224 [Tanacetum coccineum]
MGSENKPHAVLVPYPAQGHVNPFMKLAKLLHSHGFHITFVNTEFNHKRLIRSKGPESVKGVLDFRFETIPDGMPYSDRDATQDIPMLCDMTRKTCLGPFKDLLSRLNELNAVVAQGPPRRLSRPWLNGVPKVSCVISDGVMSFAIRAAKDLGILEVQFWTSPACASMGFLHYPEFMKRGIYMIFMIRDTILKLVKPLYKLLKAKKWKRDD